MSILNKLFLTSFYPALPIPARHDISICLSAFVPKYQISVLSFGVVRKLLYQIDHSLTGYQSEYIPKNPTTNWNNWNNWIKSRYEVSKQLDLVRKAVLEKEQIRIKDVTQLLQLREKITELDMSNIYYKTTIEENDKTMWEQDR